MIKQSKAATKLYTDFLNSFTDEKVAAKKMAEIEDTCSITAWDLRDHAHTLLQEYDGKENITFFWDNPDEIEYLMTSTLSEEELLKKLKQFSEQNKITSGVSDTFKAGDICWHPKFGTCKVIKVDSQGLVEVKWPENSSSQSYHSLVDPDTLTKQK